MITIASKEYHNIGDNITGNLSLHYWVQHHHKRVFYSWKKYSELRTNSKLRKEYNDKTIERRVALEDYEVQKKTLKFYAYKMKQQKQTKNKLILGF